MAIPGQTAPFKKLLVCTYKTKSNFRKMETLPDEILLETFSYLNILDIGGCAMVSKRFQRICQDQSLDYRENHLIPSLYKRTTSYFLREIIKCGNYEKAREFYKRGWTSQWHSEDSVTVECRNQYINRLVQAMKLSPEYGNHLSAYAKAVETEKTMYSIASTKKSYFYLMAEAIYKHYQSEKNDSPSFGIQEISQYFKEKVKALPIDDIKFWDDGSSVCSKLRDHMVHLTMEALFTPTFRMSQALVSDLRLINAISWAKVNERNIYRAVKSRAEYFRLIALIIYQSQMNLEDKRAKRAIRARNLAHRVHGDHTIAHGVHPIEQAVISVQANCELLKEPNYNQIHVKQKFVRSHNFKRGRRRNFFLFSDKDDKRSRSEGKNACLLCKALKNL